MLQIDNVSYAYPDGHVALSGVTLTIADGESVALMGENGAGKTTLIKHLNGLLLPSSGRVLVDGMDTRHARVSDLARKVGLVFQNPYQQLFAPTVVEEILLGVRSTHAASPQEMASLVQELLNALHLQGLEQRHPLSLSEGERKRLALAAVLATNPSILVLDEPTLGQDAAEKAALGARTSQLCTQGKSVIIATHDIDFVCSYCQRIVLMSKGRVVADDAAYEVARRGDLLRQAGLIPPQLVELSQHLASLGLEGLPASCAGLAQAIVSAVQHVPSHIKQAVLLPDNIHVADNPSHPDVSSCTIVSAPVASGVSRRTGGIVLPGPMAGHGPVGALDVRSKIVAALFVFAALTMARQPLTLILIAVVLLAVIMLDHLQASWLRLLIALSPVVILVGMMDMIYFGAVHGLLVAMRFVLTVTLFGLFFLTSGLDELSAALMSWRLPYPLVFALISGARFAPTVALEAQEIMDAYRARGVDHSTGVVGWFRRYGRILVPLTAATLRTSLRLAEAMEMRGFGKTNRPTVLHDLTWGLRESAIVVIAIGLFVLSIVM